jgi:radical S-adenosyl methionine domain-containing protein 2
MVILGVSIDSFDLTTNAAIGRRNGQKIKNQHIDQALCVHKLCTLHDILFKMNTVICSLNHQDDVNESVTKLNPCWWKAFHVFVLQGENVRDPNDS